MKLNGWYIKPYKKFQVVSQTQTFILIVVSWDYPAFLRR